MPPTLVPELICSDLPTSLDFYCRILGFGILYERPEERFAYLEREGAELMIEQPRQPGRLFPEAELAHPYGRGVNLEIDVRDVEIIHAAVLGAGLSPLLTLEERWYSRAADSLGVRQFAVQDPDGYVVRFSQRLGTR